MIRIKNKRGGFTDLFLFIIIAFAIALITGIFLYIGNTTTTQLHAQLDPMSTQDVNYTEILNDTTDQIPVSYQVMKWGSIVLIFAMILSIFYGSYKVTTRPIFFVPYFIVVIVAVILSVVVSNAYDDLLTNSQLATTLSELIGTNFMLLYLPVIVGTIGVVGGIIMFASYSLLRQQEVGFIG